MTNREKKYEEMTTEPVSDLLSFALAVPLYTISVRKLSGRVS